ncbi:hypothetical protein RRG08_002763 [Elysia crispata]|uniref:Uncharacterized protein n=1 Tax=Elysia crispata TaxID=231223 RepID=A0AAE1CMP2_9GAST|nr:hypothetical protein RRG08_002763 [Elysia crispata]
MVLDSLSNLLVISGNTHHGIGLSFQSPSDIWLGSRSRPGVLCRQSRGRSSLSGPEVAHIGLGAGWGQGQGLVCCVDRVEGAPLSQDRKLPILDLVLAGAKVKAWLEPRSRPGVLCRQSRGRSALSGPEVAHIGLGAGWGQGQGLVCCVDRVEGAPLSQDRKLPILDLVQAGVKKTNREPQCRTQREEEVFPGGRWLRFEVLLIILQPSHSRPLRSCFHRVIWSPFWSERDTNKQRDE